VNKDGRLISKKGNERRAAGKETQNSFNEWMNENWMNLLKGKDQKKKKSYIQNVKRWIFMYHSHHHQHSSLVSEHHSKVK